MTARRERGSVAILFALGFATLIGFAALAVDVGQVAAQKEHLQQTAAAAALAGAAALPQDPGAAVNQAVAVAGDNGVDSADTDATVLPDQDHLRVTVQGEQATTFARIFGFSQIALTGSATAEVGLPGAVRGAVPFGVPEQALTYGQSYTLKSGNGNVNGNFYALALGGGGASTYEANLQYGYANWIHVGDLITTQTGDMSGPTWTGAGERINEDPDVTATDHSANSPRLVVVPIVSAYGNGESQQVKVQGFATFFIESADKNGDVFGVFEQTLVSGTFQPYSATSDWGARVVRLSQ